MTPEDEASAAMERVRKLHQEMGELLGETKATLDRHMQKFNELFGEAEASGMTRTSLTFRALPIPVGGRANLLVTTVQPGWCRG